MKGSVGTPQMDAAKAEGLSVDRIAGNFGAVAAGQGSDLLHKDSNVAMIKEIFLVQSAEGARSRARAAPATWRAIEARVVWADMWQAGGRSWTVCWSEALTY